MTKLTSSASPLAMTPADKQTDSHVLMHKEECGALRRMEVSEVLSSIIASKVGCSCNFLLHPQWEYM